MYFVRSLPLFITYTSNVEFEFNSYEIAAGAVNSKPSTCLVSKNLIEVEQIACSINRDKIKYLQSMNNSIASK